MNEIDPNDCLRVIYHYFAWKFSNCAKPVQSPLLAEPGLPNGGHSDNDDDDNGDGDDQCPAGTRTRPATRYFFRYPTRPDPIQF